MSDMKNYMKLDDMETIHFKLNPAQIAALADIYEEGNGIERDELMANNLYWWSAELGDPYAQSVLSNAYTIGRDIKKSDELALFWYKKAAEQGYPYAQYELGKRLHDEEGGLLWLHLSAKQGFTMAMKELSDRLRFSDPKASQKWLKRYYRNRDKRDAWRWHGKKYMREFKRERQPEVIGGEVVIRI